MTNNKKDLLKRYLIFLAGLFVNSLGVALITKANLGTSPISSIPYVLSLNFALSLGNFPRITIWRTISRMLKMIVKFPRDNAKLRLNT